MGDTENGKTLGAQKTSKPKLNATESDIRGREEALMGEVVSIEPIEKVRPDWTPTTIYEWHYDPDERELYWGGDPACQYWRERWLAVPIDPERRKKVQKADDEGKPRADHWDLFGGRIKSSKGEFPVVFARHELNNMEYTVLGSEPRLVNPETRTLAGGYCLLSFSRYRKKKADCYKQMERLFDEKCLAALIREADARKVDFNRTQAGGDPDLFAFNEKSGEKVFVEVKDVGDTLKKPQRLCFELIEKYLQCEVRLCCVSPAKLSQPR